MLEIRDLHASVADGDVEILRGVDLSVGSGEVHAIMGPNGSGKSTLANVIAGRPDYVVTAGSIHLDGEDMLEFTPDQRALSGVFLAFQYPTELPGVRTWQFLKASVDARRKHIGEPELSAREFDRLFKGAVDRMGMSQELMRRSVNEGFSGGEKKRSEMVQMLLIDPRLAVLDETDSGLDIDALKTVAQGVNSHRSESNAVVLVTHYQRLLNYIEPDHVHVLVDGRIAISAGPELARELEAKGYDWVKQDANVAFAGTAGQ